MNDPAAKRVEAVAKRTKSRGVLQTVVAAITLFLVGGVVVLTVWVVVTQGDAADSDRKAACRAEIASAYTELTETRNNVFQLAVAISSQGDRETAQAMIDQQLVPLLDAIGALPTRAKAYSHGVSVPGVQAPAVAGGLPPVAIEPLKLPGCS